MIDYTCEMNADGWQLYSSMKGVEDVAKVLSATLTLKVRAAKGGGLRTDARIRDEMYELMGTHASFGAMDTEPQTALVDLLEDAFDLETYELDR